MKRFSKRQLFGSCRYIEVYNKSEGNFLSNLLFKLRNNKVSGSTFLFNSFLFQSYSFLLLVKIESHTRIFFKKLKCL